MSIRSEIETIVGQLAIQPTFRYADVHEENGQDNLTYPHVQLFEVESGDFLMNSTTAGIYDRPHLYVRFLDKTKLDDFASQRDMIVENMKQLAKEFIKRINLSGKYEWVDRIPWVEVVNAYDTNVSGVEINFQLKPFAPEGYCI